MNDKRQIEISEAFLKSALTLENPFNSCAEIKEWLAERNQKVTVEITKVPFAELNQWEFDRETGDLRHESGKFFSIVGSNVETNWGHSASWTQPIIHQPEIGFLGIITKEFNGILYFLMQAKIEPGNVNNVQLSPTLQATRSNYTRVHRGRAPKYLDYFQDREHSQILVDQLQSEQGSRFLRKRNRNIIVEVDSDVEMDEDFRWLTLGQLKRLLQEDNLVNMDSRTVLSCVSYGDNLKHDQEDADNERLGSRFLKSALDTDGAMHRFPDVLSWLTHLKAQYDLETTRVPLKQVEGWTVTDSEIRHNEGKYFKVIGVDVKINNREVTSWHQPLVEPTQENLCSLVMQEKNGVVHFLMQGKLECGNLDVIELAPTVQCIPENRDEMSQEELRFLDYVSGVSRDRIVYDTLQSEEGGRFYREQNHYQIIDARDDDLGPIPENYMWLTLQQISHFLRFNNYVNIEARSLLASISFIKQ